MSMRDPEGNLSGYVRILVWTAATLFCVALLLVSVAVLVGGEGEASAGDSSALRLGDDHGLTVAAGLLIGAVGGFLTSLLRSRASRSERQKKETVWRYREMSRREKRRLGAVFVLTSSVAGFPLSIFTLVGDKGVSDHPVVWVLLGGATLGTLIGFAMVLVHVRPSRTVMQIVEDRLKDERQRWAQELAALRASDAQQMERWQEEAVDTIYSVVMDQVEKGIISCAKCTESGAAHYEGHRDGLPANEPQPVEGTSKPCECDGPASIRVLYFPPRFQSKRTAS